MRARRNFFEAIELSCDPQLGCPLCPSSKDVLDLLTVSLKCVKSIMDVIMN